jgi:hypothetical protein
MKTMTELAREAGMTGLEAGGLFDNFLLFEALVRADERDRMCEQLKECSSEKSTRNEANRSAVLGESGQAS